MQAITSQQFDAMLKTVHIKPRYRRDLKFALSAEGTDWDEQELFAVWNKSKKGGLLLLQPEKKLYVVPFELGGGKADTSGRTKPVVCDLCYTWQGSGAAGYVTFYPDTKSNNSTSFLCCYDLRCSDHVRTKTPASIRSRAQLRENLDDNGRVERLRSRLHNFVESLELQQL
jgi:hypothetical protein